MVTPLEDAFPGLASGKDRITSPASYDYNCIAWAAGDSSHWWWPGSSAEDEYWPASARRERTLPAFQSAFASLGYQPCDIDDVEPGFERVAIFVNAEGKPTQASRQIPSGRWTSKLGPREDLGHALHDLEGTR